MATTLVLTFIANDRSGLVETLSETVTGQGGNWLESRMAHLAGKFAGIARIEIPPAKATALKDALLALESEGFSLTIEESTAGTAIEGTMLSLDLVGPDHPGIVREISRCLAESGVSVEEMETDIQDAPMGGGTLFYARTRVRAPASLSEEDLRQSLDAVADTLMVDITLREER